MNTLLLVIGALITFSVVSMALVRGLFAVMLLVAVYSLLLALSFAVVGAVDVSFTEAVVGASISTILMVMLLRRVNTLELDWAGRARRAGSALVALAVAGFLVWGILALFPFGDPAAPPNVHVSPHYIENSLAEMNTPNTVTTVLASYRGFDTLIETVVVLAAALACMLVLGVRDNEDGEGPA
jgi:multicomponent Na+:H+ antiporter subunit B